MSNDVLAIVRNKIPDVNSTHAFAVVIHREDDGNLELTPMDFPGTQQGKPMYTSADSVLMIPITPEAAEILKTEAAELADHGDDKYYFSKDLKPRPKLERKGEPPQNFDGSTEDVPQQEMDKYEREASDPALIRTKCTHFVVNAARHIAGIPLEDVQPQLPDTNRTLDLHRLIKGMARGEDNTPVEIVDGKGFFAAASKVEPQEGVVVYAVSSDARNTVPLPEIFVAEVIFPDGTQESMLDQLIEHSEPVTGPLTAKSGGFVSRLDDRDDRGR